MEEVKNREDVALDSAIKLVLKISNVTLKKFWIS